MLYFGKVFSGKRYPPKKKKFYQPDVSEVSFSYRNMPGER